jgi:hypothetical protein
MEGAININGLRIWIDDTGSWQDATFWHYRRPALDSPWGRPSFVWPAPLNSDFPQCQHGIEATEGE